MGYTRDKASSILAADFNSNTYIGLSTTTPTDNGGNFTEPSASSGYSRVSIGTLNKTIKAQIANEAIIFFDESVGSGYGTVTHFGVFTSKTGGTPFFTGELTLPQTIGNGYVPILRKHEFVIGLDKGALENYG